MDMRTHKVFAIHCTAFSKHSPRTADPPHLSLSLHERRGAFVSASVLFTSTETVRLIRDGEPRTATSNSTQLLSADLAPDVVEVLLYVHKNRMFIRDGSPGRPPRLPHSS